eukprot:2834291-Amphidinium_carterae.1
MSVHTIRVTACTYTDAYKLLRWQRCTSALLLPRLIIPRASFPIPILILLSAMGHEAAHTTPNFPAQTPNPPTRFATILPFLGILGGDGNLVSGGRWAGTRLEFEIYSR